MTTDTSINTLLRTVSATDTAALRARLAGDVIVAGDARYETARKVHNQVFDPKPAIIARARGAADVAESVKFARARNYAIAVRGGGHSLAAHCSVDDSLVIDLSEMKAVSIDAKAKVARVQAGATTADLAGPAHAYGLSVSTGDTASVGLGGLITGGGIGWMARKHGLAIDNLLSVEVVTADGEILRASAKEHQDLFWAIRGGGGNFGIATEFELKLWPDGSLYGGALVLPATREVIRGYLEFSATAPDELTTIAHVMHAPPVPFVPENRIGELVLMVSVAYAGSSRAGDRAIQPLRRLAPPVADALGAMPYPVIFGLTENAAMPHFASVRAGFVRQLSHAAIETIIERVDSASSPMGMVQIRPLGGAIGRVPSEATAFAHREKALFLSVIGAWLDPDDDAEPHQAWTKGTWALLRGETSGAYANFLEDEGVGRVREAYPDATYARLACVKAKYDAQNVFQFNQNIKPASQAGERAAAA